MREHLQQFADERGAKLRMFEFGILMDEHHDVVNASFWEALVQFVRELKPFAVLVTPPCSA